MSKLIDVEKLITKIERRKNESREIAHEHKNSPLGNAAQTMANEDEEILSLIDSLQQEQQETEMKSPFTGGKVAILSKEEEVTFRGEKVKILRKYYRCEDTGKEFTDDKLDNDMMWTAFRTYCEKKGMTSFTDIMFKQEQQEVDLEKEFEDYLDNVEGQPRMWHSDEQMEWAKDIARHFWNKGYNAKKEDTK